MKAKFYMMVAALFALAITGCNKENDTPADNLATKVVGEWHCTPEEYDIDVYVSFTAEGTFDEYQRIGEGRYRHYTGTWAMNKSELSGVYADGTAWGSSYKVSFSGEDMLLTSTNDTAETMTYVKEIIPDEVKHSAIAPFAVRADDMEERWF
ncbi:MAG: lipocalin family protein [Alistipes sp.]|nr:lipocalin family protein [Alistipes sp.]